jgi:hypothetical protein
MKHCDLTAILALRDNVHSGDIERLVVDHVPAMAAELAAWRALGTELIAGAQGAHDGDREASRAAARSVVDRMRALLPPDEKGTDDGQE